MDALINLEDWWKSVYVLFAFCSAFFLGALKGFLVGPIACLILIAGNVGIILGLLPAHIGWTIYAVVKTNRYDIPLKVAILFALPALFGIWLGLSIAGNVLVGIGYGFFTPWISTFEAFRHDNESKKIFHCVVDGTWGTIKGSCTVVTDFADICYHSYPAFLKEFRESPQSNEVQTLRLILVPGCIIAGVMGLVVDIPLFTAIAIVKSPYMLLKGWFRLLHDLVSREGPFLETACIPIAGLTILMWPIIVVGSILISIFSSFFIGLYGSVVVYQERSFRRGLAYVIAMVAEFDEYTNDWLYLREGTIFPRPRYRKVKEESLSSGGNNGAGGKFSYASPEAPGMFIPNLAHSVSVREAIHEVKMVQIWEHMIRSCEMRGKELLNSGAITPSELHEYLKAKNSSEGATISVGLPCYSLLHTLLNSIKAGSNGLLLIDGVEVNYWNRPKDKLLDWFFNPIMVLKEQIRVLKLEESEIKYLEKVVLFGSNTRRMNAWDNGSLLPEDALIGAQIQGISRRMIGMVRGVSKLPTYRRRFRRVVKDLILYSQENDGCHGRSSPSSVASSEEV
ncbi:uncharacterized membrane protein At3g27390 isoform X1 [Carica papaya]|uniref:uncharacterized membrane protein At3g27390 isoform X1 n=1 Tax=Carica papaya TaxID=3649 RepID=UPI000B8CB317|nr:uncharacterized membrane protein At3g27390 isoform X1 [Carica papaya]